MALLGALEAIRSGTTLVLEEGAGIADYAVGLFDSGLRLLLCERAWDRAGAAIGQGGAFEIDAARAETSLARIADLHKRWNGKGDGRVQVGLAAWAPELCSPELLMRLRGLQGELDVIATIHLNQIWGEVAAVREQRGMLPTEYLASVGFLSHRLVAAHCRCMTAQEEWILGSAGVAVAVNSAIAARRGSRRPGARARASRVSDRAGHRQHGRGHGRGRAHRALHGARAPARRAPAHAGAGARLGHPQRLPRARHHRRRLARRGQPCRSDRDRSAQAAPHARRCASSPTSCTRARRATSRPSWWTGASSCVTAAC